MARINSSKSKRTANSLFDMGGKLVPCKVKKVLMDPNTNLAQTFGGHEAVGLIFYNKIRKKASGFGTNVDYKDKVEINSYDGFAKPLFPFLKYYPLINEVVTVITLTSKDYLENRTNVTDYYFPPLNLWNHPHHNTLPSVQNYQKDKTEIYSQEDYGYDGLVRRPIDGEVDLNIPLGKYFKEYLNIKPLLPYEGDLITEGRFGNSIRLGATARGVEKDEETGAEGYEFPKDISSPWSKGGASKNGDPIIIMRNGQPKELDNKGWEHTIEDINLDPSSIYLTSTQNIENLQVAAEMCWYSFGLNVETKEEDNKAATNFLANPIKEITAKEVTTETETETETAETSSAETETTDNIETETTGSAEIEPTESISEEEAGMVDEEDTLRYYDTPTEPELEAIDGNLPEAYRLSDLGDVPYYYESFKGEGLTSDYIDTHYYNRAESEQGKARCTNCAFFKAGSNANDNQCSKWNAKVRRNWYCNSYGNGLLAKLEDYPNFGTKHFTITSPDPHVGKKGYLMHVMDVGKMYQQVDVQIIKGGGRMSPDIPLHMDPLAIAKTSLNGYIHEYVIPKGKKGEIFVKFDDESFGQSLGLQDPPPPPPPPFFWFLGKKKFGQDVFETVGVGRARNGGKAMASEEIMEDAKQKALRAAYDAHTSTIGRMYGTFEDFLFDGGPEMHMMKRGVGVGTITIPLSRKEWQVGYRWQITHIEEYPPSMWP